MTSWACLDGTDVGLTRLARWALAPFVSSLVLDLRSRATFLIVSMLVAVFNRPFLGVQF